MTDKESDINIALASFLEAVDQAKMEIKLFLLLRTMTLLAWTA
jgi:hypothetical protein